MEMRTVLLPTDFSQDAESACQQGFALATRAHARILLLHVLRTNFVWRDTPLPMREQLEHEMRIEAEQRLRLLAASQEGPVETLVLWGHPAVVICHVAAEQEVDLIVMSTHGRSGHDRWVYGSVADKVLRHADVPVLLVRSYAGQKVTA